MTWPRSRLASGKAVSAVDDRSEIPPFADHNPTITKPSQFGGNGVVVKIRPGVFGHYYHLQPGSVRVEVGQRVRTGQKLGLLGNTGNTTGPHLHYETRVDGDAVNPQRWLEAGEELAPVLP